MNLLGIGAHSMLSENSDRAALRKAQLITSIVALWGRHSSEESKPQSAYSRERERSLCQRDSREWERSLCR